MVTVGVTTFGYLTESEKVARICFWQSNLLTKYIQSGPIILHDYDGTPMMEGTVLTMFLIFGGMLSGIPIYGLMAFLLLTAISRLSSKR